MKKVNKLSQARGSACNFCFFSHNRSWNDVVERLNENSCNLSIAGCIEPESHGMWIFHSGAAIDDSENVLLDFVLEHSPVLLLFAKKKASPAKLLS